MWTISPYIFQEIFPPKSSSVHVHIEAPFHSNPLRLFTEMIPHTDKIQPHQNQNNLMVICPNPFAFYVNHNQLNSGKSSVKMNQTKHGDILINF